MARIARQRAAAAAAAEMYLSLERRVAILEESLKLQPNLEVSPAPAAAAATDTLAARMAAPAARKRGSRGER